MSMTSETIIEFKSVSFGYDSTKKILENVSFCINKGESIGLVGANGAGKSTLMKLLLGLETNFDGNITVAGLSVNKKNLADIRKKTGFVLQNSDNQLFCHTVYDDICFGPVNYGYAKEEVSDMAEKAMEMTGTGYLKDVANYKLSGGEKKLAAIASILSLMPEIIIMDEPESSLDPANRKRIKNLVNSLEGTKIIASHDLDFIWETTDRVLLLGDGTIKAFGNTKDILIDEILLNENSLTIPNCAIIEELRSRK
ncbi:MAG: energy-coupling factor ABC transporter ATP-binding protein [Lachnospiraceae bacterium]|nr:energy-coupling factor ABC transporter ATP-binding protein [Lachnospiraceae bacterium]